MREYTEIQKQIVMLTSDILPLHLNGEEVKKLRRYTTPNGKLITPRGLQMLKIEPNLKKKLTDILGTKMQFGLKLVELGREGIEIIFNDEIEFNTELKKYCGDLPYIFTVGNPAIISNGKYCVDLNEAFDCENAILVAHRPFNQYLSQKQIAARVRAGKLIIVSKYYHIKVPAAKRKRVFISGSQSFSELSPTIVTSIQRIVKQGFMIVLGDANQGADIMVANYLRKIHYPYVTIYTLASKPNFPVAEKWVVKQVVEAGEYKAQEKHMQKDREMAQAANWGLAIFNAIDVNRYGNLQVSAGTLRNVIQLLLLKKPVKFFYTYGQELRVANLRKIAELEQVLMSFATENLSEAEEAMIYSARGVKKDQPACRAKYQRILKKYKELLKKEKMALAKDSQVAEEPGEFDLFANGF